MYFDGWRLSPDDPDRLRGQIAPLIGTSAAAAIDLRHVLVARDALKHLPDLLRELMPGQPIMALVVMDDTPMRRGEDDLKRLAIGLLRDAGVEVEALVLSGHGGHLHTDERAIARVADALRPGVAALALGSGTISDITKHGSHTFNTRHGAPHGPLVMVPTAASVPAYAINQAVLLIDGVKRTQPSRWPTAIVADLAALASAPHRLTAAGFGDLTVRFVATADWWLSDAVGMCDDFPPDLVASLSDCDALLSGRAAAIGAGDERAIAALVGATVEVGALCGTTGQTTLLSSWEHVISHVLDMTAAHQGRQNSLHGAQVGVGTLIAALAYERLLARFDPAHVDLERCYPGPAAMRQRIEAAFGPVDPSGRMAAECWRDYAIKLERWHAARPTFSAWLAAGWPGAAERLRGYLTPPAEVARIMREARAPLLPEQLEPPIAAEQLRWAILHAHLIRRRFTIGDLLFFLGWLDMDFADQLLDAARALDA